MTDIDAIAMEHSLDPGTIASIVDILGEHRIANPRVSGDWMIWDLMVSETTIEKRYGKLKSRYPASFVRRGNVGVHLKHARK